MECSPVRQYVSPDKVRSLLPPFFKASYAQHDCTELARNLLDLIEVDAKKRDQPAQFNLTQKWFEGKTVKETMCQTCNTKTERSENFVDLSVNFGKENNLEAMIVDSLADEVLNDEDNLFFCDTCDCKVPSAVRAHRVVSSPHYLLVTLNRFYYDKASQSMSKIMTNVDVPLRLEVPSAYKLKSVVIHAGKSAGYGHYYAAGVEQGKWRLFNDFKVSDIASPKPQESMNIDQPQLDFADL